MIFFENINILRGIPMNGILLFFAYFYEMKIKKIAQLAGHQGSVFALAQGHTPQYILSGAGDGWIVEWDLNNPDMGKLLAKVESNIFSLCFISEKNILIAGNMNGGVHFIDLNNTENNKNVLHHRLGVYHIQIIDNQLFTLSGEGVLTRWNIDEKRTVESIQLSLKSLRCLDYSASRQEIAIGASDGHIYFLDLNLSIKRIIKNAHKNSVFTVRYTPDGKNLLSGGRDALLKVWSLDENTEVAEIAAHLYTINSIVFHPRNPHVFATGSRDKTIKIWQIGNDINDGNDEHPSPIRLLKVINTIRYGGHTHSVNALLWTTHHNRLISASDDRSIIVWEIDLNNDNLNDSI